eukprot:PITA_06953
MNLSLILKKYEFLMNAGTVLGHLISQEGIQVDPNKIVIIKRVHTPQKQRDVRSFLGLARYYRRFIKDFRKVASPLLGLLAMDTELCWTDNWEETLEILKEKLTTAPILRGPNWALSFHIHVYSSDKDVGVTLGQIEGDEGMVDDQCLDDHLFFISALSPWFSYIANSLVTAIFPPNLSSREKSRIVRKSPSFTWIRGNIFKLGLDQILRRRVMEY